MKTDNELIAEFMGYKNYGGNGWAKTWVHPDDTKENRRTFNYHSSWDWLMPVVEKIEAIMHESDEWHVKVNMNGNICRIVGNPFVVAGWDLLVAQANEATKIQSVYKAIIEFIKFYNDDKSN